MANYLLLLLLHIVDVDSTIFISSERHFRIITIKYIIIICISGSINFFRLKAPLCLFQFAVVFLCQVLFSHVHASNFVHVVLFCFFFVSLSSHSICLLSVEFVIVGFCFKINRQILVSFTFAELKSNERRRRKKNFRTSKTRWANMISLLYFWIKAIKRRRRKQNERNILNLRHRWFPLFPKMTLF